MLMRCVLEDLGWVLIKVTAEELARRMHILGTKIS